MKKAAKKTLKAVAYRFIRPDSAVGTPMYALLRELVDAHHQELAAARIALAWHLSWQPDIDGRVTLGKCKKVSDLEREVADLAAYDFVIILRQSFYEDLHVTDLQRRALLDHELCHATVKLDDEGEPVVDERNRTVYRTRKHDLEEFAAIAERYGCWKRDLAEFGRALERARQRADGQWIGYTVLHEQLRGVGLSVPITLIASWTDAERREASIWAILRKEFPHRLQSIPAMIAGAATSVDEASSVAEAPMSEPITAST